MKETTKISAGNGYTIEVLEGGYKVLRCPDDVPGEMGHGICAYSEVNLGQFKKLCAEFIRKREEMKMLKVGELKKIDADTLLSIPKRKRGDDTEDAFGVFVVPNNGQRDSGWGCMDFVAETSSGYVGLGGVCEDVDLIGPGFKMDCAYPSGIIHIWNRYGFSISYDAANIRFVSKCKDDKEAE